MSNKKFISEDWGVENKLTCPNILYNTKYVHARRKQLSKKFPNDRLIIPSGGFTIRNDDVNYPYRPNSNFSHLTGLGINAEPSSILVMEPSYNKNVDHNTILYIHLQSPLGQYESYSNSHIGEFWVGKKYGIEDLSKLLGIQVKNLSNFTKDINVCIDGVTRVLNKVDTYVDSILLEKKIYSKKGNIQFNKVCSELRLIKDEYAISEIKKAVYVTTKSFNEVIHTLSKPENKIKNERLIDGLLHKEARTHGNNVGYTPIVASGNNATILHWSKNNASFQQKDMLLIDFGIELNSLYTADITRTIPISGKFNKIQRKIYDAVLESADAAFAAAIPGNRFIDIHKAAIKVIVKYLNQWGLLPCSAEETIKPNNLFYKRWMMHGTSHHLGLDVHDCSEVSKEKYLYGILEKGMVLTIEPGLYFKNNDLKIPQEYRGIGIRIEDDLLITENGSENLSHILPRKAEEIELWMEKGKVVNSKNLSI